MGGRGDSLEMRRSPRGLREGVTSVMANPKVSHAEARHLLGPRQTSKRVAGGKAKSSRTTEVNFFFVPRRSALRSVVLFTIEGPYRHSSIRPPVRGRIAFRGEALLRCLRGRSGSPWGPQMRPPEKTASGRALRLTEPASEPRGFLYGTCAWWSPTHRRPGPCNPGQPRTNTAS